MKNNDMLKKMKKSVCVLLATTFIGAYATPVFANENDTVRKDGYEYYSLEDAKEAVAIAEVNPSFEGEKVLIGENKLKGYKVGCYVTVNGRGNEASDGSGLMGRNWENEKMLIVGVRENSEYPYACAIVDDDPNKDDVMAWFKEENLDYFKLEKKYTVPPIETYVKSKTDENEKTKEYFGPTGYKYDPKTKMYTKTEYISPVYSDSSEQTIAKTYKISLK